MATTGGARLDERTTAPVAEPRLLTVSAAARLLGVSSSSLRAWAAAGRVPHVRTPGGHRRFELDELVRWLSERGGAPPAPQQRLQELVPTRVEAMPETARALADAGDEVLSAFEEELARTRPSGANRPSAARQTRVLGALEALAGALDSGDLAGAYRDAEWEGFRHGASGQPGDAPVTEALALRRAVDRVLGPILAERPAEQRAVERSLDRMAVRVAAGYADGVRCRLRSTLE
jgi:excisionase family DNA binding protein